MTNFVFATQFCFWWSFFQKAPAGVGRRAPRTRHFFFAKLFSLWRGSPRGQSSPLVKLQSHTIPRGWRLQRKKRQAGKLPGTPKTRSSFRGTPSPAGNLRLLLRYNRTRSPEGGVILSVILSVAKRSRSLRNGAERNGANRLNEVKERSTKDHRYRTRAMLHLFALVHKEQLFKEIRYP